MVVTFEAIKDLRCAFLGNIDEAVAGSGQQVELVRNTRENNNDERHACNNIVRLISSSMAQSNELTRGTTELVQHFLITTCLRSA